MGSRALQRTISRDSYSHCIAHGIDMRLGLNHDKMIVETGLWPLYRFNPDLISEGKNPLSLDSKPPSMDLEEFFNSENRFMILKRNNPAKADELLNRAKQEILLRRKYYEHLAAMDYSYLTE